MIGQYLIIVEINLVNNLFILTNTFRYEKNKEDGPPANASIKKA